MTRATVSAAPLAVSSRPRHSTGSPRPDCATPSSTRTALCSPTRAALITGRNHHSVGFGVIAELSTGFPGYDSIIGLDNATIGTILRDNGYATSWFGKNHNTPGFQTTAWPGRSTSGRRAWASTTSTASWAARPTSGRRTCSRTTRRSFPWIGKPGYNLTTDMADEAINYMEAAQRRLARPAVLRLLRARRQPLAAPADQGVDRQVQGQVRHGLERHARTDLRQPEAPWRDPGERQADRLAGQSWRNGTRCRPTRRSSSPARRKSSPPIPPTPTTRSAGSSSRSRTWASWTIR